MAPNEVPDNNAVGDSPEDSSTTNSDGSPGLIIGEVHTRFNRQADFVPYLSLDGKEINVIGVGAIGRQVALQLAAIGVRKIRIFDFDTVTPTNVTTQGFLESDVGKEKVHAMEEAIKAIDSGIEVEAICDRYRPSYKVGGVVFICVDSIAARSAIYNQLKDKVELIIDGRMLGEIMRVLVAKDEESKKHYEASLFPPSEQVQGRCTGHATIYCATIAGGLMVHQFTRTLRGFPTDMDMSLNLLAGELGPVD